MTGTVESSGRLVLLVVVRRLGHAADRISSEGNCGSDSRHANRPRGILKAVYGGGVRFWVSSRIWNREAEAA